VNDSTPPTPLPLPIHVVSKDNEGKDLVVKRRPGRPRVVRPRPSADEMEYTATINKLRAEHVDRDPLVHAETTEDLLKNVVRGLAEETACLRWLIERGGLDPRAQEQCRSRRIDGLHKIALTLLGKKRVGIEPDISPEKLERIAKLWLEMIREAAAPLPQEVASPYVARVEKAMAEWLRTVTT
jgi:hypothetical protein